MPAQKRKFSGRDSPPAHDVAVLDYSETPSAIEGVMGRRFIPTVTVLHPLPQRPVDPKAKMRNANKRARKRARQTKMMEEANQSSLQEPQKTFIVTDGGSSIQGASTDNVVSNSHHAQPAAPQETIQQTAAKRPPVEAFQGLTNTLDLNASSGPSESASKRFRVKDLRRFAKFFRAALRVPVQDREAWKDAILERYASYYTKEVLELFLEANDRLCDMVPGTGQPIMTEGSPVDESTNAAPSGLHVAPVSHSSPARLESPDSELDGVEIEFV